MIRLITIVLPVIMMLAIGRICGHFKILGPEGAAQIKKVIVTFILPVAVFHGIATGSYSFNTLIICIFIFVILLIELGAGFLYKPLIKEPQRSYLPFMMAVYEGGMIIYPLYTNACGMENLANVATLDIANAIFCYSIGTGLLKTQEEGTRPSAASLAKTAITTPTFVATIIGVILGSFGLMGAFLATPAGGVYQAMESMLTAPLSPMILLVVGYDMDFDKKLIPECAKAVFLRLVTHGILLIPALILTRHLFPGNRLMEMAILVFMTGPPSFSIPAYVKKEEGSAFFATTNSLYVILTLIAYCVIVAFF